MYDRYRSCSKGRPLFFNLPTISSYFEFLTLKKRTVLHLLWSNSQFHQHASSEFLVRLMCCVAIITLYQADAGWGGKMQRVRGEAESVLRNDAERARLLQAPMGLPTFEQIEAARLARTPAKPKWVLQWGEGGAWGEDEEWRPPWALAMTLEWKQILGGCPHWGCPLN